MFLQNNRSWTERENQCIFFLISSISLLLGWLKKRWIYFPQDWNVFLNVSLQHAEIIDLHFEFNGKSSDGAKGLNRGNGSHSSIFFLNTILRTRDRHHVAKCKNGICCMMPRYFIFSYSILQIPFKGLPSLTAILVRDFVQEKLLLQRIIMEQVMLCML